MPDEARNETRDPLLLTPGPLTTSHSVKAAMLHDYGSRDRGFIQLNADIRRRLVEIANGTGSHVCVPLQGSGTFVVEAMLTTLLPRDGRLLIAVNGAYGHRMAKICKVAGRDCETIEWPEDQPVDPGAVAEKLAQSPEITHVAVVHCETTSGIRNPLPEVAKVVSDAGRRLLVDSMSAFGAMPLDVRETPIDAVVASSNKCLEGVPGMGFCIVREEMLRQSEGNAVSLSLDLFDQWQAMEKNGQWRFTPPTHAMLAFKQALDEFDAEGGVAGRGGRYTANCRVLVEGMRALGFRTLLPDELQAPIIITFHMPADPNFDFQTFYDRLGEQGFVIYPGKLTVADSFRVGCIGRLDTDDMRDALAAIRRTLGELGVRDGAPATAGAGSAA